MKLYKREFYLSKIRGFYHSCDLIKVITGIRRCGKSSLMRTIIDELLDDGVRQENIIYINLDKKGYMKIKTNDQLEAVIDAHAKADGVKYLFIDEIQNVADFEILINAYREEGDYSIFVTGSNSYLLSGELITKLTGRYLEFELFTLSFAEYLDMKKFYKLAVSENLLFELDEYIVNGGFPETLLIERVADKQKYVREITSEIIKKDVYRRIKVKNRSVFELVMNYMLNNYGMPTSLANIQKALLKNGNDITQNTVSKYVTALVDAKIIYPCERFDMKSKKYLCGEKKYYLADLSFCGLTNPDSRINYGPALENIVYIYAKSNDYTVCVGRIGKLECDFILKDGNLNYSYVQVAYTINESRSTEDREYAPLERIKDNYPKYVATVDYLLRKRNGIIHINLLEFMKDRKRF